MPIDGYSLDQCIRKVKMTKEVAIRQAQFMTRKTGEQVNPYICHFKADHWHIGRPHTLEDRGR